MKRLLLLLGAATLMGARAMSSAASAPPTRQPRVAVVTVFCPQGNREAFVDPKSVNISRGDHVEWRMAGNVRSDSLQIFLKDSRRAWPFSGSPARGRQLARASAARDIGTYSYNVRLLCRIPNQGLQEVIIDPDIIID